MVNLELFMCIVEINGPLVCDIISVRLKLSLFWAYMSEITSYFRSNSHPILRSENLGLKFTRILGYCPLRTLFDVGQFGLNHLVCVYVHVCVLVCVC